VENDARIKKLDSTVACYAARLSAVRYEGFKLRQTLLHGFFAPSTQLLVGKIPALFEICSTQIVTDPKIRQNPVISKRLRAVAARTCSKARVAIHGVISPTASLKIEATVEITIMREFDLEARMGVILKHSPY
jgi:hypothetical protein